MIAGQSGYDVTYLREAQEEELVGAEGRQAGQRGAARGGPAGRQPLVGEQRRAQPAVVRDVLALRVEPVHLRRTRALHRTNDSVEPQRGGLIHHLNYPVM